MLTCTVSLPILTSFLDYPSNEDHAIVYYMMGCDLRCFKCHNAQFQDPNYCFRTVMWNIDDFVQSIQAQSQACRTTKVVLTGGDPLSSYNQQFTVALLQDERMREFDVCVYTGTTVKHAKTIGLTGFTFLKTECFDSSCKQHSEKTDNHMVFASRNQQLYDSKFQLLTLDGVYAFNNEESHQC